MKRPNFNPLLVVGAIVVILVIAPFAYNKWFSDKNIDTEPQFLTYVDRGFDPKDMHVFDERIAELESNIESSGGTDINSKLVLGNVYYTLGDLAKAEELYLEILEKYPNDAAALESLARTKQDMMDFESAEGFYRQALNTPSGSRVQTYIWLTEMIKEQYPDRHAEVRTLLEQGVQRLGQEAGLMVALGNWYLEEGMIDEAISHYEIAVQVDPEDPGLPAELERLKEIKAKQSLEEQRKLQNQ